MPAVRPRDRFNDVSLMTAMSQGGEQRGSRGRRAAQPADDDLSIGGNTRDLTTVSCG